MSVAILPRITWDVQTLLPPALAGITRKFWKCLHPKPIHSRTSEGGDLALICLGNSTGDCIVQPAWELPGCLSSCLWSTGEAGGTFSGGPESKNVSLSSLFNTPQLAAFPLWCKSGHSQHTRAVFGGDDLHTQFLVIFTYNKYCFDF